MFIHEEIQKAVLPLIEKYDLELIDLIGEINHAAWELSVLNDAGLKKLIIELGVCVVESQDAGRTELPEVAMTKPANSEPEHVCRETAHTSNV